jgi:SAM-dependent methyltransferase
MDDAATGQISTAAAEIYEAFFVPALFAQFAGPVADATGVQRGQAALDVACGTGVLARALAARVGDGGRVVGLDRNPGMLAVARAAAPRIDWRAGMAEALPFEAAEFDAVTSAFALMFFEDRATALAEMWRVLRPGGRMAVAVWDVAEASPGYAAMIDLLERLFGPATADALRAPFALGDPGAFRALFERAGIPDVRVETTPGVARFPSIEEWVRTDVKGWTLADMIDDAGYERLQRAAREELRAFAGPDGAVAFPAPAHVAVASRR